MQEKVMIISHGGGGEKIERNKEKTKGEREKKMQRQMMARRIGDTEELRVAAVNF